MGKVKPSRKELLKEPDEFLTFTGRLLQWASAHKTQIVYGTAIFAAALLIFSGYRFFSQRAESRAAEMLWMATAIYDAERAEKDPQTAYQAAAPKFEQLLKDYGGTDSGGIARYRFGNISYEAGKFKAAIELYNAALADEADNAILKRQLLTGLGYAYEELGETESAVLYFEKLLQAAGSPMLDEALFNLGRLYQQLGNDVKSRENYQRLLENYPESIYVELVKEKIRPADV
jgi:tetratricopeptide (TPR) repeat protein